MIFEFWKLEVRCLPSSLIPTAQIDDIPPLDLEPDPGPFPSFYVIYSG